MPWTSSVSASYSRMYKGQPSTTAATIYTAPTASTNITGSSATAVINSLVLTNTTSSPATVTIGIGGAAAANQIIPTLSIGANDAKVFAGLNIALLSGETVQALQGTASAITVTMSGDEYA